jgi:ABC-2 type transport system permease protein
MNERVKTVIVKEWAEARKNSLLVLTAAIPAVIFAVMPAIMVLSLKGQIGAGPVPEEFTRAIYGQFLMFFILLPVIIPSTMASYSIIGEKQNRSLEPLLATPITTEELLLGKSLASIIPSVILPWVAYVISIIGVYVAAGGPRFIPVIFRPEAIAVLLLLSPVMATLGMLLIVLISARSNDPREAQQWSVFLVLPMIGLSMAVMMGKLTLTIPVICIGFFVLLAITFVMLRFVVMGFQREVILTRWK